MKQINLKLLAWFLLALFAGLTYICAQGGTINGKRYYDWHDGVVREPNYGIWSITSPIDGMTTVDNGKYWIYYSGAWHGVTASTPTATPTPSNTATATATPTVSP